MRRDMRGTKRRLERNCDVFGSRNGVDTTYYSNAC